jgi:hypothetical protein
MKNLIAAAVAGAIAAQIVRVAYKVTEYSLPAGPPALTHDN